MEMIRSLILRALNIWDVEQHSSPYHWRLKKTQTNPLIIYNTVLCKVMKVITLYSICDVR